MHIIFLIKNVSMETIQPQDKLVHRKHKVTRIRGRDFYLKQINKQSLNFSQEESYKKFSINQPVSSSLEC